MKTGHLTCSPDLTRAPRSVCRLLIETGLRALCRRRLRQALVAVLTVALVLTALPLARRVNPPVQAQGPTVLLRTCEPGQVFYASKQIIQKCQLGGSVIEADLEGAVINDLLKLHQLPWSDKDRLLGWERNLIRAGVLERIVNLIKKSPAERAAWEQTVFSELTKLVKARRVLAATKAQEEYNRWLNNCPYTPPPPFTRSPESCVINPSLLFGGRTPPSFEEFQAYGGFLANKELNDPTNQVIMKNTARGVGLLAGVVGAGLAAALGAAIGATTAFGLVAGKTVFITFASLVALAAKGTTPIVVGGVAGATAIAAPVAIVIFAVVVGVIRGIQVFEQEEIPGKLQEAKTRAENETPDLTQLLTTEEGLGEIYAEFIQATLPDFPATTGVPAASAVDPQFEFRPDSVTTFSPTPSIEYQDWEGDLHTVRMNGGWFVDRKGSEAERLTLSIQFINHQGRNRQASRSGGQFVISDLSEDKAAPQLTGELQYLNGNFEKYVARIPNIIPVITTLPVVRHAEPPAPEVEWDLFTSSNKPTNYNVSQIATITDNDSIAVLDVAITSPLTSNGVTLSELKVNADGKVFARIQPSCSATDAAFTLEVKDTAGVTATETINVTVTPNQSPTINYRVATLIPVNGTGYIVPTVFPSDDNTSWGLPPFNAKVWTLEEPVITPNGSGPAFTGTVKLLKDIDGNATGTIEVSNAGPLGAYDVRVTVKDTCGKTTVVVPFLSVRCIASPFTYSATNPASPGAQNGQITLNAGSNASGARYSIDNGVTYQSSNVFTGLAAGDYFVTLIDGGSCVASVQKVTLTDPPPPITVTTTEGNPTCYGASNGQITVNASGGAGALQYSINNGQSFQSGNVFTGLTAGSYPIKVKDANGNSPVLSQTVVLVSPAAVSFNTTLVNPTCYGASNGQITVNASGGVGPYLYSRDNGVSFQSSNVFSNLAAGSYQIKVKDSKGCSVAAQTVTLTNPAPVTAPALGSYPAATVFPGASTTVVPASPPSGGFNNITAAAPGFSGTISVNPTTGVVTINNAGPAGIYTVTVTASQTCAISAVKTFTLNVTENICGASIAPATLPTPTVSTLYAQILSGSQPGGFSFSVSSGSLPPGLSLRTVLGVTTIAGIPTTPGTYNFTIKARKNNSNCATTRSYTLTIPGTVEPILNCVMRNQNGSYTARFGYQNTTGAAVTIPVGASNYFTPGAQNRGQTTVFQPGIATNAFSVTFNANGSNLGIWLLKGPDGVLRTVNVLTTSFGCP